MAGAAAGESTLGGRTQGAPRKMRRQGAATPGATHRVSVGVAPSIRLPRQPRTAPLRRLPPHRSPWRRQFARHPGSTAENAAAGRGNPGGNSQGVCGRCPQRSLAATAAHRPAQALAASPPPWRRQFGGRHPGSTAENAAAGRGNPGAHSPGVCGMCPQPPLAAAAANSPAQALATCSPAKRPAHE